MKKIYLLAFGFLLPFLIQAQLITTTPAIPTDQQSVTLLFDATKGDAGLKGYTGNDVYAYTGVITNRSTSNKNWLYIKNTAWLDNPASCKLTRIATDLYELTLTPTIRAFYGVPDSEKILDMTFVFRNADGSKSGRDVGGADILVPVHTLGLNVSFSSPAYSFNLVDSNQLIPVSVNATDNDSLCLFLDNVKIRSSSGSSLTDTVFATGNNLHTLVAAAYKNTSTVFDTVHYLVHGSSPIASLPDGIHDGINYINDTTVTFVLLAPYKNHIYLLGDFNNWTPNNNYLMARDSMDTARYWITVSNLVKGKEYIFQYLIDDSIRIADPYCEKISDPWNDQYISTSVYPNLVKYPTGKTTGIAGVIQTARSPFNWQVTSFTPPDQKNLVIYELLIRDFTANHDIKTAMDSIPYLKRLGVNAIELMPFNEFDGNDSWGYNPAFYFAPDKAYGTPDDYKRFVDACHAEGIAVIQDMVLDFSTNNSPLVQMYFANGNPTTQNPWYDTSSPNTAYAFGNVFNHASPYTRKLTDSITSFWMTQYKIDGFRFDFAKGWTNTVGDGYAYDAQRIQNFELASDHIWSVNPNAYVILELFTANDEELLLSNYKKGMLIWGNMNCAYNQATMGFGSGSCTWDLGGISYENYGWMKPGLIGYMESHDEERLMYKNLTYGNSSGTYNIKSLNTALKRQELASCLFYTVPGPKMLWQFGELGYDISINYNGRTGDKPIHWEYYNNSHRRELYNVTKALIGLKENEPIFSTSTYSLDVSGTIKQLTLTENENEVHVVANCDVNTNISTVTFSSTGYWYDYFDNDSINVTSVNYTRLLDPGEYHLYSNHKLYGFGNSVMTGTLDLRSLPAASVYPNPTTGMLYLDSPVPSISVELFSSDGTLLMKHTLYNQSPLDLTGLHNGMYLIRMVAPDGRNWIQKIVKE